VNNLLSAVESDGATSSGLAFTRIADSHNQLGGIGLLDGVGAGAITLPVTGTFETDTHTPYINVEVALRDAEGELVAFDEADVSCCEVFDAANYRQRGSYEAELEFLAPTENTVLTVEIKTTARVNESDLLGY